MAEHQLDDADVHTISEQATGALVPYVMPMQIDLPELLVVDGSTL